MYYIFLAFAINNYMRYIRYYKKQEVESSGHADIILNADMFMHRRNSLSWQVLFERMSADLIKKNSRGVFSWKPEIHHHIEP